MSIISVTLTESSPLIGKTLQEADFRSRYHCMVVGVEDEKLEPAMDIIDKVCKSHKQVATTPSSVSGTTGMYMPYPVEVTVGGATIFVLDVEQFVKI